MFDAAEWPQAIMWFYEKRQVGRNKFTQEILEQ